MSEFWVAHQYSHASFIEDVHFRSSKSFQSIDLSDILLKKIFLENTTLLNVNYLRLNSFDLKIFSEKKEIIKTKLKNINMNLETTRLIKNDFESKKNIIEANKYFAIEQELYLKELKEEGLWKNIWSIITVWLHGTISNFGTSWIRVLMSISIFTMLVFLGYEYTHNCITIKEGFYASINKAIELIDPLKMFKGDDKTYENHNALGFIIRIITIYLFYQFITAFRNNTRRK